MVMPGLPTPIFDMSSLSRALNKPSYESDGHEEQYEYIPSENLAPDSDEEEDYLMHCSNTVHSALDHEADEDLFEDNMGDPEPDWLQSLDNQDERFVIYERCFKWLREYGEVDIQFAKMLMDHWGNQTIAKYMLSMNGNIQKATVRILLQRYLAFCSQHQS